MTAPYDVVSLVDWHFRRATVPAPGDATHGSPDGEAVEAGDGSDVTATRG